MIKIEIDGSVERSFSFPADIKDAFIYYQDLGRIVGWLRHVRLVDSHGPNEYRVQYSSVELGVYRVNIYCDLVMSANEREGIIRYSPQKDFPPVKPEVGVNSLTAHGFYSSESVFRQTGNQTMIDYRLSLKARLPVPIAARIMPVSMLDLIAKNIMYRRIYEIADGFIEGSVQSYKQGN
jgi:hypothetical protein